MEYHRTRRRCVGHGRWRLEIRLGQPGRQGLECGNPCSDRCRDELDRYGGRVRAWATRRRSSGKTLKGLSKKPYIFTKCERRWNDGWFYFSVPESGVHPARNVKTVCGVWESNRSIFTRFTGLSPKRKSKRAGPKWPD